MHHRYPTRPHVPVLRGLNLTVRAGSFVALVGPSGCGKSTTIGLLERFYSPLAGRILLDGRPIEDLEIESYRSHISLVAQEPTLYDGDLRTNVCFGHPAPETVTDAQVEAACRDAKCVLPTRFEHEPTSHSILDFINSLPDGFNTKVGSKGAQLSGGQRQRVAIARALIRCVVGVSCAFALNRGRAGIRRSSCWTRRLLHSIAKVRRSCRPRSTTPAKDARPSASLIAFRASRRFLLL